MKEFKINSKPELTFRIAYISPIEGLAIVPQIDLENHSKAVEFYTFALEHAEVKIGDQWFPVKTKGRDTYMPIEIEKDWDALQEISEEVFQNLLENFPKSRG